MQSGDFKQNNLVFAGIKINQDQQGSAVKLYMEVLDAFVLYITYIQLMYISEVLADAYLPTPFLEMTGLVKVYIIMSSFRS